jgi:acyl-CoA synthetase (AMP-forming)/AMP-acid ligase II
LVGQVVPDVEIGIFDGRGERCKVDEVGIVKGRLHEEPGAATSGRGPDRSWADLGDLGWVDAGGRLFIAGRTADAPAAGAQRALAGRISLVHEVEHLVRLEWDLVDAAAILAEDTSPSMPEIWVGIVGNKDVRAEALRELLRLRGIENPLRVMSVPAIPRGANGKVNRADLNSLMRASAGRHCET